MPSLMMRAMTCPTYQLIASPIAPTIMKTMDPSAAANSPESSEPKNASTSKTPPTTSVIPQDKNQSAVYQV